jgi:raffinose/stachyose/melibiose transport system permease protein
MSLPRIKPYAAFIAPGFVLYSVFMILPLFTALGYSFYSWSGVGPKTFVGLENYRNLFFDPRLSAFFWNALWNNFRFVLRALLVILPLQLGIAYYINIKASCYRFFQTMVFLPYVVSTTIIGFLSIMVFDPNLGILNGILDGLRLASLKSSWFGNPKIAFDILVGVITWQGIAAGMLIFLANLKEIPRDVLEASLIDGAGGWTRFRRVVLPALGPSLTNNIVLGTIWGLTQFDIPYIVGGPQGGVNNSMDFMNLYFYRFAFGGSYFGETSMGFGATISVVLFAVILAASSIQLAVLRRLDRA